MVENLSVQTGLHHQFARAKHESLLSCRGGASLLHVQRGELCLVIVKIIEIILVTTNIYLSYSH